MQLIMLENVYFKVSKGFKDIKFCIKGGGGALLSANHCIDFLRIQSSLLQNLHSSV